MMTVVCRNWDYDLEGMTESEYLEDVLEVRMIYYSHVNQGDGLYGFIFHSYTFSID